MIKHFNKRINQFEILKGGVHNIIGQCVSLNFDLQSNRAFSGRCFANSCMDDAIFTFFPFTI